MHPCLIRRGYAQLRLSFRGAVWNDPTIFHIAIKAALNPVSSLSQNVDIIAQPFSASSRDEVEKEDGVTGSVSNFGFKVILAHWF